MKKSRTRRITPSVTPLESRCLLAVGVTSLGQDGHDLEGPDAALVGADGIQDLHLRLSNLRLNLGDRDSIGLESIEVSASSGLRWFYRPFARKDLTYAALRPISSSEADLYINPTALVLQGSPPAPVARTLAPTDNLTVTVNYNDGTLPEFGSVIPSNLVLPPPAMTPRTTVRSLNGSNVSVTWDPNNQPAICEPTVPR